MSFKSSPLLSEWPATAIAGNDILSSILYTIGICSLLAGKWTPISLAIVTIVVLYPFRRIYQELGEAMPWNGGSFNCVLQLWKNDTYRDENFPPRSRFPLQLRQVVSIVAGVLSLLSYISTAVVSAASAILYGAEEFQGIKQWQFELTITILIMFALLTFAGLRESSGVAMVIFTVHCATLSILLVGGLYHAVFVEKLAIWKHNFGMTDSQMQSLGIGTGAAFWNLFYGVMSGLLGITGFETTSNYIEEQQPGVFPKALRNMWILVTIFNPALSIVSLGVLPLEKFASSQGNLLSVVAEKALSPAFRRYFAADAVMSLSGGALTAYIGMTGLVLRMTQEGMFPQQLMAKHHVTGTHHNVIAGFMFMTCLLFILTGGSIKALSGVYTVSFLGVLGLATGGCLIIRRRDRRQVWTWELITAISAIIIGICGQVILNPSNFLFFTNYFVCFTLVICVFSAVNSKRTHIDNESSYITLEHV